MAFEEAFGFSAAFALPDGVAAIVEFFALGESDFYFGVAAFGEEKFEGDEGEAFLGEAALKTFEFFFVEEELSGAAGVKGGVAPLLIGRNVHVVQVKFWAFEGAKGILQVGGARAERLDFGACEHYASCVAL
jgi:hypothetical protein